MKNFTRLFKTHSQSSYYMQTGSRTNGHKAGAVEKVSIVKTPKSCYMITHAVHFGLWWLLIWKIHMVLKNVKYI